MDDALDRAPKFDGSSFRTIGSVPPDMVSNLKVGGVISDSAFSSSRKKPDLTTRAAFVDKAVVPDSLVMRIEGKTGVDISNISNNPGESEVLFPRDTKFKIDKIQKTKTGGWVAEVSEVRESIIAATPPPSAPPAVRESWLGYP